MSQRTATASTPTSCCSTPTPAPISAKFKWGPELFGYQYGIRRRHHLRRTRQCPLHAQMPSSSTPDFDWHGQSRLGKFRVPFDDTILYEMHVKGFTKLHPAVPRISAAPTRPRPSRSHQVHQVARRHLGRAAAHPYLRQRQQLDRTRPEQLLGLQHHRLLRARTADVRRRLPDALKEFKDMVAASSRSRARGHPRRRLQPYRRRQRARPTLSASKASTTLATTAHARQQALLHQRHRHREHSQPLSHPRVIQMVTDSLRYWVEQTRVDGFRFDLGTILAREPERLRQSERLPQGCQPGSMSCPLSSSSPNPGIAAPAATRWAASLQGGRSGMTSFATPCGTSGKAMTLPLLASPSGSVPRRRSSTIRDVVPGLR